MSKQIIATVYLGGVPQDVAFNTDFIYLQEVIGDDTINCNIFYFGNPLAPTIPTNIYQVSDEIAALVSASDNSLVQATIWRINSSGKFSSSIQYAFPVAGYSISIATDDDDINSIITYRGNAFSAEETQADLVTAANAGGGGGGVGTLQQVTDLGSTTNNVITTGGVYASSSEDTMTIGAVNPNTGHAIALISYGDGRLTLQFNDGNNIGELNASNMTDTRQWEMMDTNGLVAIAPTTPLTGDVVVGGSTFHVVNGLIMSIT